MSLLSGLDPAFDSHFVLTKFLLISWRAPTLVWQGSTACNDSKNTNVARWQGWTAFKIIVTTKMLLDGGGEPHLIIDSIQ